MELERLLDKAGYDSLSEAIRGFYAEKDGKYTLNIKGYEDSAVIEAKLAEEQTAKKKLEDELKAFKGTKLTPEQIAELVKKAEENGSKLTELEKLQKKFDEMQAEQKIKEIRDLKVKALRDAKYPDEKIEELLTRVRGEDADAITADVAALVKILPPVTTTGGGGNPPRGGGGEDLSFKSVVESVGKQSEYESTMGKTRDSFFKVPD